jgi:hypothetical protein
MRKLAGGQLPSSFEMASPWDGHKKLKRKQDRNEKR